MTDRRCVWGNTAESDWEFCPTTAPPAGPKRFKVAYLCKPADLLALQRGQAPKKKKATNADQLKIVRRLQSACQVLKTQSEEVSLFRPLLWKPNRMAKSDWGEHSKFAVRLR